MTFTEILNSITDKIREGFNAAIQSIVDAAILKDITEAVEANDFETVWRLLGVVPGALRPLTQAMEQSFEQGTEWIAVEYPKILYTPDGKGVFRFNILNPRAQQWLTDKSSTLITKISDDARESVRMTLDGGMAAGRNPRQVALDIVGRYDRTVGHRVGGVIGLTPQQQGWVASARRRLEQSHLSDESASRYLEMKLRDRRFDSVVEAAMRDKKPLTRNQIDSLVSRYADRTLKYRGDTIARTESIEALEASKYESTKQIVETGAAREQDIKRTWDDAGDQRVRHSHAVMNGQTVGLDEPFVTPDGQRLMYPHDTSLGVSGDEVINCRCHTRIEIDWIGAAVDD